MTNSIRTFTTKAGISFQVDNETREGVTYQKRPFCLFRFDDDFDSNCYFVGNYGSFEDAFDAASRMTK
jgi:hypothetical protein